MCIITKKEKVAITQFKVNLYLSPVYLYVVIKRPSMKTYDTKKLFERNEMCF